MSMLILVGPSTPTTDEHFDAVKKMILGNHRITIREVAEDVDISLGSCQAVFTDVFFSRNVRLRTLLKNCYILSKNNVE